MTLLVAAALAACAGEIGPEAPPSTVPSDRPGVRPSARPATPPATGRTLPPVRYVALGDSYTIGTSVRAAERWPDQLVAALRQDHDVRLIANPAVNGYTTDDLIRDELPVLASSDAHLVSVLIGVNDVVRGRSDEHYRSNLQRIFDAVLAEVAADRAFVVSTPDYTRTPKGRDYGDPDRQRTRIAAFNRILRDEAGRRGIAYVDITPVADRAAEEPDLVAGDGLHPSGEQYRRWVERIAPVVRRLLEGRSSP